jgi:glycosyltransferase involved in cell wall biosynthesis
LHCSVPEVATYVAFALPAARRLIKRRRPDLVHAHFIFPDGFIAWMATRGLGIPYIITAHGTDVPGYNPHRVKTAHRVLAPLWKKVTTQARAVVCPSEDLKRKVEKQKCRARVLVIPNGIDPSRFENRPKQKRILVVTRMVERKGIQFLIEAVRDVELDHEIHIVGDGHYLPRLKEIAKGLRMPVKFWGRLPNHSRELTELYETSSIYVLPSEAENFPVVLLEAMAARCAVITSKGTGCEEVVGDAGALVDPKDAAGIRDVLLPLAADPDRRRGLGAAARRRVEENFGWPAVARRHMDLYEQQMGAHVKGGAPQVDGHLGAAARRRPRDPLLPSMTRTCARSTRNRRRPLSGWPAGGAIRPGPDDDDARADAVLYRDVEDEGFRDAGPGCLDR